MRPVSVLARFLPAILALLLPYFTPDIRKQGPTVGAGWIQDAPEEWSGSTVSIMAFVGASEAFPKAGATLAIESLQSHKKSPFDKGVVLLSEVSTSGTHLTVQQASPARDPSRGRFLFNMCVGLVLIGLLPVLCFERGDTGAWRLRPWIR